jgi:hypothetical protein
MSNLSRTPNPPGGFTLPNGEKIDLVDICGRQLVIPAGTMVQAPKDQEWFITAMSVLPSEGYTPPDGVGTRSYAHWGDVQILYGGKPYFRTSVLTLMDRYWGRYNLNPSYPDVVAKLEHANHAVRMAPKIRELAQALEHAADMVRAYLQIASPAFPTPIRVKEGESFTVEHVECEHVFGQDGTASGTDKYAFALPGGRTMEAPVRGAVDVELLLLTKRRVL